MYATVDLHNLFHFLKLRTDSHAQWEIRQFADAILTLIEPIVPLSVEAWKDYSQEARNVSKLDQKLLRDYFHKQVQPDAKFYNMSKREYDEMIRWIDEVCSTFNIDYVRESSLQKSLK